MTEIWVDEEGNEYTADELDFETPKAKENKESVASTRDYIRATAGLVEDFLPYGETLIEPPAAYIASTITGEDYDTVREKMKERGEEAKANVARDLPTFSSAFDVAVPLAGSMASMQSGISAVGAAAPSVISAASKVPGVPKVASTVGKGVSWLADKPVIRTALSTDPLKSSAAMSGIVGAGSAALDLAQGKGIGEAVVNSLSNAADTFAYMYGGRTLPYKAVPLAMAGYEVMTNPVGRLLRQEKTFSKEDLIRDAMIGTAGGALSRTSRAGEGSTVKGSKIAKRADRYKGVTNQTAGDIDVKAKEAYSGQKNLRDIPLEANVATQASLKTSIDKEIKQTASHHKEQATAIGKKIKSRIAEYEKGTSTEDLQDMLKRAEEGIAKAEDRLKQGKPVTGADVNRVFADNPKAKESLLMRYARAESDDTGGFIRNIELDDNTVLDPEYLLRARAEASKQSTGKGTPVSKAVRDKTYDLFDDVEAKKLIRESNALYSKASQLTGASEEALKSAKLSSDPKRLLELSSQPGANRELTSQIKRAINENRPISSIPTNEFDVTTLPSDIQKYLKEYDYQIAMQRIAEQDLVRKGTKFAITESEQRAAAAPFLGSNFAMYTGVKEAAGKLGRHLPKAADKEVLKFMSEDPVEKAIEALNAREGSILRDSIAADFIHKLSKMPKKGGK